MILYAFPFPVTTLVMLGKSVKCEEAKEQLTHSQMAGALQIWTSQPFNRLC